MMNRDEFKKDFNEQWAKLDKLYKFSCNPEYNEYVIYYTPRGGDCLTLLYAPDDMPELMRVFEKWNPLSNAEAEAAGIDMGQIMRDNIKNIKPGVIYKLAEQAYIKELRAELAIIINDIKYNSDMYNARRGSKRRYLDALEKLKTFLK